MNMLESLCNVTIKESMIKQKGILFYVTKGR